MTKKRKLKLKANPINFQCFRGPGMNVINDEVKKTFHSSHEVNAMRFSGCAIYVVVNRWTRDV